MKINKLSSVVFFTSMFIGLSAQSQMNSASENGFNKWSVEFSGGVNKPQRPLSTGYFTSTPSPYVADLGVRYMLNNKFGLKADIGLNSFRGKSNSLDIDTQYYRVNLQGVANLGRIMDFESWTKTIGLLGHAGFGVAQLEDSNSSRKDRVGNFIAGLTGQIKLSNRLALTGDFTTIFNASQDLTFDGHQIEGSRGFGGVLFNGTVGLNVYLGKNQKHADWVIANHNNSSDVEQRLSQIESDLRDSDKDGVADYLDIENATAPGTLVGVKGNSIDKNNNKIQDDLEDYLLKLPQGKNATVSADKNESAKELINGGYVSTFFEFNKSVPTDVSTEGIDFIRTYMKNNPSSLVNIIGHADEIGNTDYNNKLAETRAINVKAILLKAGIADSRLKVVSGGEDSSVDKDSEGARRLSRRVTFKVQ